MSEINTKAIVGETFEDMSLVEMTLVQGSGEVNPETTPATPTIIIVSEIISGAGASGALSILTVNTFKGKCS
jgi:type 2 lantibiotic (TIGR03893 family)